MSGLVPQTTAVPLAEITLSERVWPRQALDAERVALFTEMICEARDTAGTGQAWSDPLPPLVLVADGRGGYILADGRHRYEARRLVGLHSSTADLYVPDGQAAEELAYELALRYATVTAKPLNAAEKRAAIGRLIRDRTDLSDRAIARLVGVSNSTVSAYRKALCEPHTAPASASEGAPGGRARQAPSSGRLARVASQVVAYGDEIGSEGSGVDGDEFVACLADAFVRRHPVQARAWVEWWLETLRAVLEELLTEEGED